LCRFDVGERRAGRPLPPPPRIAPAATKTAAGAAAAAAEVVAAATTAVALTMSLCGRAKSGARRRAQKVVRAMMQLTVAATAGEAMPAMAAASGKSNAVVVPPSTAVSTARGLPRQRVADGVRHRSHRRPRQVL